MKKFLKTFAVLVVSAGAILFLFPLINQEVSTISTTNGYSSSVVGMAQTLPLMYIACIILVVVASIFGGKAVIEYVRYKKWEDFGNRLKLAYAAKFGGENSAFNKEIDDMVLQCKTMKKGIGDSTKSNAEMRLKRYAHMVEVPYIIPEEEHLSEVEKTEELMK